MMKKIITILFAIVLFSAPVHAQALGELGKALGTLVGKKVINSITNKVEQKSAEIGDNAIVKALQAQADSTEMAPGTEELGGLGKALSGFNTLIENSKTAGMAPLRDFREQNAARKEHNLTLEYDDWDIPSGK